jgi:hypothetical protein
MCLASGSVEFYQGIDMRGKYLPIEESPQSQTGRGHQMLYPQQQDRRRKDRGEKIRGNQYFEYEKDDSNVRRAIGARGTLLPVATNSAHPPLAFLS